MGITTTSGRNCLTKAAGVWSALDRPSPLGGHGPIMASVSGVHSTAPPRWEDFVTSWRRVPGAHLTARPCWEDLVSSKRWVSGAHSTAPPRREDLQSSRRRVSAEHTRLPPPRWEVVDLLMWRVSGAHSTNTSALGGREFDPRWPRFLFDACCNDYVWKSSASGMDPWKPTFFCACCVGSASEADDVVQA